MQAERPHRATRRLVARFLDAGRPWTGGHASRLREHTETCAPCRDHYRRELITHRVLVGGGDVGQPTGFEERRTRDALLDLALGVAPGGEGGWWLPAIGGAGAAAAALALVMIATSVDAPQSSLPGHQPTLHEASMTARGGGDGPTTPRGPLTGIGLSGVVGDGSEYEVVASGAIGLDAHLKVTWTNERPELAHLFVFSLQPSASTPGWIAPLPSEGQSLSIATGKLVPLPFESRVGARHTLGPVRVVAIFSSAPLMLPRVAEAVDLQAATWPAVRARAHIRQALQLQSTDVVQILDTSVAVGSAPAQGADR